MFTKNQVILLILGIAMLTAAGVLGFGQSNWMAAVVLGGIGSSTFIVGSQADR